MQLADATKRGVNLRFGTAVRRFRNELGISQESLAERAGLDRTYIGHVERGARNVSLLTISKLACALEISTATLLASPAELSGPRAGSKKRFIAAHCVDILMVEDNRRDAELTQRAFKKAEIKNRLQVVYDGAEALEFIYCTGRYAERHREGMPNLVLLDLNLPKVSGLDVLRRLKSDRRTRHIPVIILTISRSKDAIAEAMRLGAAAIISKPVDFRNFSEVTPRLRLQWALVQPTLPHEE